MADDDWWGRVPGPYGKQSRVEEILEERDLRGAAKADWLVDRVRDVGGALGRATDAVLTGSGEGKRRAKGWVDEYGRTVYVKNPGSRYEQWYRIDPETGLEERVTPAGLTPEEDKAKKGRQLHTFGNELLFSVGDKAIPRVLGAVGLEDDPEGDESRRIQRSKDIEENYPEDYWTGLGGAVGATLPLGIAAVDKYLRGPEISRKAAQHLPRLKDVASRTALGRRLGFGAGTGAAYSGIASYGRWDESDLTGEAKFYEDLPLDLLLGAGFGTTLVAGAPALIKHARKLPGLGVATGAGVAGSDVLPSSVGAEDRDLDKALKIHQEKSWDEATDEWQRQYGSKNLPPVRYGAGGVVKMAGGGTPLKFFSVLQKAIEDSPQKKMQGEQWKSYLKPGREVKDDGVTYPLRQDELDFTELDYSTTPAVTRTPEEEARYRELVEQGEPFSRQDHDDYFRLENIPKDAVTSRVPFVDYLSKRGKETLTADDLLRALSTRDLPNFKIHGGGDRVWVDEAVHDAEMESLADVTMSLAEKGWTRAQNMRLSPERRALYEQLQGKNNLTQDEARLRAELAQLSIIPDDFGGYGDKVFDAFIDEDVHDLRRLGISEHDYNKTRAAIEKAKNAVRPPPARYGQYVLPGDKKDYQEDTTWWKPTAGPSEYEDEGRVPARDRIYRAPHVFSLQRNLHDGTGLLSWSRATSRNTVDGKPVMVVEEIQSDLHQKAREGYRPQNLNLEIARVENEKADIASSLRKLYETNVNDKYQAWLDENPFPQDGDGYWEALLTGSWRHAKEDAFRKIEMDYEQSPEYQALKARQDQLREEADRLDLLSEQPPPAPYSKTYAEMELRKQLMHAIDEGMDLVTVTTGRQQAERWRQAVAEHIDEIAWSGNLRGDEIRYSISPMRHGTRVPVGEDRTDNLTEAELKNLVGVDVAKKIIEEAHKLKNRPTANPNNLEMRGEIKGTDITIGAQGMRHFYDRVVPEAMKKLAKQYGMEMTKVKLPGAAGEKKKYDEFFDWDDLDYGPRDNVNWEDPDAAEGWAYGVLRKIGRKNPYMPSSNPKNITFEQWRNDLDVQHIIEDWPDPVKDLFWKYEEQGIDMQAAIWHAVNGDLESTEYYDAVIALRRFLNEVEQIAKSGAEEMTALKITPEAKQKILKRGMPYFAVPAAGAAAAGVSQPDEAEAQGFAGGGKDLGLDKKKGGLIDFDPEGDGYDYDEADKGGLGPDDELHWPSRRPLSREEAEGLGLPADSGLMLKGRKHPTWGKAIEADEGLGYRLIQKNGRWYTVKEPRK